MTLQIWADNAGADVAMGLVATSIIWDSNSIPVNGVVYGYLIVTVNSADLSGVLEGHVLTLSGFSNAENNGSFYIVSANDAANTITIRQTTRTDGVLNESGATADGDVRNSGSHIQEPGESFQRQGFATGMKIAASHLNWMFNQFTDIMSARRGFAHVGLTSLTNTSYTNIDGAGVPYAATADTTSSTYTPSADDNAFETLTGTSETITTQANRVLHIMTATQSASGSLAGMFARFRANSTDLWSLGFEGAVGGAVQFAAALSLAGMTGALSAGSNTTQFQTNRKTGRSFSLSRAAAFELRPTDDAGNSLIYASSIPTTDQTIAATNTYTDLTGYAATETWHSNVTLLVIAQMNFARGSISNGGLKMLIGASTIVEWLCGTGNTKSNGELATVWRLHDLAASGSQTLKLQAKASGSAATVNGGDVDGVFYALELPDTYQGVSLLRNSQNLAAPTTSSNTAAQLATTGTVSTSGNYVVMFISGLLAFNTNSQTTRFQFKVDGVATDDEYEITFSDSNVGDKFFTLAFVTESVQTGNHTYSIDWRTSAGTATGTNLQFAAFEMCQKDEDADEAAAITLTEVTGKKIELCYTGVVEPTATADIGLRFTQDGVAVGQALEYGATANKVDPFTLRSIIDAPTAGTSPVFRVQGKAASGNLLIDPADFSAIEISGT